MTSLFALGVGARRENIMLADVTGNGEADILATGSKSVRGR